MQPAPSQVPVGDERRYDFVQVASPSGIRGGVIRAGSPRPRHGREATNAPR